MNVAAPVNSPLPGSEHPAELSIALKEWSVAVRALREGRQVMLLRKGGIHDVGGQFEVAARDVLLFPTYLHENEQVDALQPCYGQWRTEEDRRRPEGEVVRIDAFARITDILIVRDTGAIFTLASQHIYSDALLRFRIESEPNKPLYALFLRAYDLPRSVIVPMEMDYYGCKSWITLNQPIPTTGAVPCLSEHTYQERVRVARRLLAGESNPTAVAGG